MSTIHIGNCSYALTKQEIVFNRNQDTGHSLTMSYETPEESVMATLPRLGSSTRILSGVILDKITVTYGEAGISKVKLDYAKDIKDEEEDGEGDNEGTLVEQSLEGSVSDEPILTHPNCEGLGDDKLEYFKAIQDGARLWEKVTELNEDGSIKLYKGQPKQKTLRELTLGLGEKEKAIGRLLLQGVQSYRCPGATWREKRIAKSSEVNLGGLGSISTPKGAPSAKGRDWLMIGKSLSKNPDGRTWTIETIYEMSGPKGWDKSLYS